MDKIEYEQNVEYFIKTLLNVDGSDAQGIMLSKENTIDTCFKLGKTSFDCCLECIDTACVFVGA